MLVKNCLRKLVTTFTAVAVLCVYTSVSFAQTKDVAGEITVTGQVTVNDTSNYWELHLPFGGWAGKSSGRGRVGGRHIFDAMTQIRSVAFDVGRGSQ